MKKKDKLLFLVLFVCVVETLQALEFKYIDVQIPEAIDFSNASMFRALYWVGCNRIVLADYFGERRIYLIDISTGQVINEFRIGEAESIKLVDRRAGMLVIWSPAEIRRLAFDRDPTDINPPHPCMLSYEYHGAPKGRSTFNFLLSTTEASKKGTPHLLSEIFPPGELGDPGPLNVVDCSQRGDFVLLSTAYESSGSLYYAHLDELNLVTICYLGLLGRQAFFLNDGLVISFKHNEEIETGEDEPNIYYPVVLSTKGDIVFEDRSIRLIQSVHVFDYDPVTERLVAIIQGPTRTSSRIAVFQIAK